MSHQYSRNPDHIRRRNVPAPDNAAVNAHLQALLSPAVYSQQAYYRSLGLRDRILTLPLMVAAVVSLLWHQVPSVVELTRMLNRQNLLWAKAVKVSRQALSERFLSFPYAVFERVFQSLVPELKRRWDQRCRPLPASVAYAMERFERIWVADGSVLEALFRKLDSLQESPVGQLAGKICMVMELGTQLPVQIWFTDNPKAHDCQFLDQLLELASANTLLLLDRGFYDFEWWSQLMRKQVEFIGVAKANLKYRVLQSLTHTHTLQDQVIAIGSDAHGNPLLKVRLIAIRNGKGWYRYLTSVLDPECLPPYLVADLYARRWRIEISQP